MLIAAVLFGLVFLRWGLLLAASAFLVARVRRCPACFDDTVPVIRPWLRRLLPWLEWRWCQHCGWEGPSRRDGNPLVPGPFEARTDAPVVERRTPGA